MGGSVCGPPMRRSILTQNHTPYICAGGPAVFAKNARARKRKRSGEDAGICRMALGLRGRLLWELLGLWQVVCHSRRRLSFGPGRFRWKRPGHPCVEAYSRQTTHLPTVSRAAGGFICMRGVYLRAEEPKISASINTQSPVPMPNGMPTGTSSR
jgi:hypothetical protein